MIPGDLIRVKPSWRFGVHSYMAWDDVVANRWWRARHVVGDRAGIVLAQNASWVVVAWSEGLVGWTQSNQLVMVR